MHRRRFFGAAASLGWFSACRPAAEAPEQPSTLAFAHGVASGDPLFDRVMIWTRVSGEPKGPEVEVEWEVARTQEFDVLVAHGRVVTGAHRDFTVKIDVTGLASDTTYYYRFSIPGPKPVVSETGTTKTLARDAQLAAFRFAMVSCANYPQGYFHVYRALAQRDDLDVVIHLGDYIYEYKNGQYGDGEALGRVPSPPYEAVTLTDYRERYSAYRLDPDLQAIHARHPFIVVWDDHESANNAWVDGAENHQSETEGDWQQRKLASIQAYMEWMPIREHPTTQGRIYRGFRIGELVDLLMLDTRLIGRDQQVDTSDVQALADSSRSLLGKSQQDWLHARLTASKNDGIVWRLLGQQVLMGQLRSGDGSPRNSDMWDGYASERERLLNHLITASIDNVVVLTGDIHSSWALELTPDPFDSETYDPQTGRGAIAVELVTPAVSSPGPVPPEDAVELAQMAIATHPHIKWVDLLHRGFVVVDVTRARLHADWYLVDTVTERRHRVTFARAFEVEPGHTRLLETSQSLLGESMPSLEEPVGRH